MKLRGWLTRFLLLIAAISCMEFSVGSAGQASAASTTVAAPSAAALEQKDTKPNYSMTALENEPLKGETVQLVVRGERLKDVYAFEIGLAFDANKLKWLDAATDVPGFSVKPIVEGGEVKLAHTLVGDVAGISGTRVLYTIRFEAIQAGRAEVVLREVSAVDSKLIRATDQVESSAALTVVGTNPFKDLAGFEWAREEIAALASEGIILGTTEDTFSPGKLVKRADFLLLLMRTLELAAPPEYRFADVDADAYYADSVASAASLGIAKGDGRGLFRPASPLAREEMMALTERALRAADRIGGEADMSVLRKYGDRGAIADYAGPSIAVLTELGMVQGYTNSIHPKRNANRAQAAMIIYNVYSYIRNGNNQS
ncbi:S-layer homology domain-containing protein [Paenibacillus arenilitoris]|uniref:S-layer homology domain-containing protein n=1 Tax=Paenibacillus arenilitoris TaxID=2772299 RepID=A0A927CRX5_9BACL|nr:S-layer homology domain-containing protein [Paenibacillus arenilitoris]MBD2872062.1 S-layer homology domain-containing protein [Paenibacillus arenilitoris]